MTAAIVLNKQVNHANYTGVLIFVLLLISFIGRAQCPNDNVFFFDGQRPPCVNFDSVSIGGGTYATFIVDNGRSYTFSTCNSSFNTTLTAYDTNGNLIFFNDDSGPECATDRASITWTANFTGTIRLMVDSFPCTSYSLTSAVLHYRQDLSITSSATAMCTGETRTLAGLPAGGVFSGNSVVSGVFTAPNSNGIVTISYTNGQCITTQDIQVNRNPVVSILNPNGPNFCEGDSVVLTANAVAGSGTITNYQWQRNGVNFGPDSSVLITVQDSTYTVTATNSNGCSTTSASVTLTEFQNPTVNLSGVNPDYCINDPGTILAGTPVGGTFSGPGVGAGVFVPFLAGVGTHTVIYSYTAPNGCDASDSLTTVVNDIPVVNFPPIPVACLSAGPVQLLATPLGGTYSGVGVSGDEFDPVVAGVGGPYTITYTFTDTIGCMNTATGSQQVNVRPSPTATFSGLGAKYCVDASGSTLTGTPTGGTFSGTGISGNQFDPAAAGAGTHQITYTYADTTGCSDDHTVSTTVHALPNVTLSGLDPSYCVDASSIQMTGTPAGGSYSGTGLIANAFNPALAGVGGPYTIIYNYADNNGCKNSDTLQVSVTDVPTLSLDGLDTVYCLDAGVVQISPNPPGGQLSGPGVSGTTFDPSVAGLGSHVVVYIYASQGCSDGLQFFVKVKNCPVGISFSADQLQMKVYPNPSTGVVMMELSNDGDSNISVYNMHGQRLATEVSEISTGKFQLDLSSQPRGIYYLEVVTGNDAVVKKIVLE